MHKYVIHGDVGVIRQDTHEELVPYHDIEIEYESQVPLDVKNPAHFALAVLMVKEEFLRRLIAKKAFVKFTEQKYIVDVLSAGLTEIEQTPPIEVSTTERGRTILYFKDRDGYGCSLQKSSTDTEPRIWFGITKAHPVYPTESGEWLPYPLAPDVDVPTRMHMNQEQVVRLLPYLEHFVRTGELL